jgi:hypothetical protein
MLESREDMESLLKHARELERKFDWDRAAADYRKASRTADLGNPLRMGQLREAGAYAAFRFAFQAEKSEDFVERLETAASEFGNAKKIYAEMDNRASLPWTLRCEAMKSLIAGWSSAQTQERTGLFGEAWRLAKESIDGFESVGENLEFARTLNSFNFAAGLSYYLTNDFKEREKSVRELLAYFEKAARLVDSSLDTELTARTYFNVYQYTRAIGEIFTDTSQRKGYELESGEWWKKAFETSREAALTEWIVGFAAGTPAFLSEEEIDQICGQIQQIAEHMRDRLVSGSVFDYLGFRKVILAHAAEEQEERDLLLDEALENAHLANREFSVLSYICPWMGPIYSGTPDVGYNMWKAIFETDLTKKRQYAQRGIKAWPDELQVAVQTGWLIAAYGAYWDSIRLLTNLAMTEKDSSAKRKILEESMSYIDKELEVSNRLFPYDSHKDSIKSLLADTEYQLSEIAVDKSERIDKIRNAIKHKREDTEAFLANLPYMRGFGVMADCYVGSNLDLCGKWSTILYEFTANSDDLKAAIEANDGSIEYFQKAGWPSRCAEGHWQAAQGYGRQEEHKTAAEEFARASECYHEASKKLPRLRDFFLSYQSYMKAWSEIEKARYHHDRQEPASAKEHFEKAAELHESTGKWSFLSTNYLAWARVENAEDMSQKERSKESIDAFREAERLFKDSKSKMLEQLTKIEVNDEKQMVERLIGFADNRQELCSARVILEEARLLDKGGNLGSASEMYGLAGDALTKIKQGLTAEQDRKEIELIIALSKAWKAMAKAEAKSSPELYEEAAHFFDEAKNLSPGDRATNLAMGHSRFCKALQAGVRFCDTGDLAQHEIATDNLESAGKYYLKAGLESASEYARASSLLFDAYVHMSRARKEQDPEKKAKSYTLAEKMLQASSSSYDKADQPGKKDQVQKLLSRVQQDKEFAISLTEILRAPDVVSTTMAFSSPTPTQETAVGLDRFEHADIQANLIALNKELNMDEDLILGIELVNAGRGPAQLIKLQDILPKGFTLREEAGGYRMEDSYLDLRGKRLDALKTEEINLVLKPVHRGQFTLKPRILYLDESGKYKSHEPEPMKITVGADAMATADQTVSLDTREAAEARSLLTGLNVVTLSHYRIVGNYVRYGKSVCNDLKDARQKIVAACHSSYPKRENYIIWAPPGSGKTYFVQEVAALLGDSVHYSELNLAKLDEAGFRSGLAELRTALGPCLCLVDEVDAKPDEPWPYEALMPFLDASATEGARLVFVLAGSSGSSVEEMKKAIASRPKGSDILSRVPTDNEYSIPPMGMGDRLLVVLSQFRQAGNQMGHDVREVEKLGLYYVALNPRLSNARQLREFAVRCAERVLPGDDRLKYDSLFRPGDLENKLFWTQALQSAGALVDSFLLVED